MTDKETARRIIQFDAPDRVLHTVPSHEVGYFGVNHENPNGGGHHLPVGSSWTDIWGTEWHKEHPGVMGFPRGFPLAELPGSLSSYTPPDPHDPAIYGRIYQRARSWNADEAFLVGPHRDTLWEKSYMLAGMEGMMLAFYQHPEATKRILRMVMDFQLAVAQHYLEVGVELVTLGDDLGTQSGPLLSPRIVEEFLLPEYKRLCSLYRANNVLVSFHSCGHVEPMLGLFMELGVDILNPVQATANNLSAVRRRTAGRMALHGGVRSATLVSGPPSAIRVEVAERIRLLGRDGGYFCSPDQGMPWPEEHYRAFVDAVHEFGTYPLGRNG